jgi:hypothetical protein
MVISALVVLYWMFDEKRKPFDTLDYSIILFVCLSLIIGVLFTGDGFPQNIFQLMWGAKYGFLFLILFFFVRKIPIFDTERNDLINAALFSGSVVIVFGLLQASLLPEDFLVRFGYSPEYGNTTAGETLSYCHKIENTITHEEFCRVQSTLSGPNQLGAYTLVLMPFFLLSTFSGKDESADGSLFDPTLFGNDRFASHMVSFGLDRCCSDGGSLFYYSSATFLGGTFIFWEFLHWGFLPSFFRQ